MMTMSNLTECAYMRRHRYLQTESVQSVTTLCCIKSNKMGFIDLNTLKYRIGTVKYGVETQHAVCLCRALTHMELAGL